MKALKSFRSPLMRQVNEPVRVLLSRADMLLHSKNEFHRAPLTRLIALTGLQGDQGEDCIGAFLRAGGGGGEVPAKALGKGVAVAAEGRAARLVEAEGRQMGGAGGHQDRKDMTVWNLLFIF